MPITCLWCAFARIAAGVAGVVSGNPGYLAGYAVLMLFSMVLMDAGYRLLLDRKSCGT